MVVERGSGGRESGTVTFIYVYIVPWLRVRREICFVHNFVSFQWIYLKFSQKLHKIFNFILINFQLNLTLNEDPGPVPGPRSLYHDNLFEIGGSRKPPSRYPFDLKFCIPSIWSTSRSLATFEVSNSILTWFFWYLNMAIFGVFTEFRIAVLASFRREIQQISNFGMLPSRYLEHWIRVFWTWIIPSEWLLWCGQTYFNAISLLVAETLSVENTNSAVALASTVIIIMLYGTRVSRVRSQN